MILQGDIYVGLVPHYVLLVPGKAGRRAFKLAVPESEVYDSEQEAWAHLPARPNTGWIIHEHHGCLRNVIPVVVREYTLDSEGANYVVETMAPGLQRGKILNVNPGEFYESQESAQEVLDKMLDPC